MRVFFAILGALPVCMIHYHFIAKPYLDSQQRELKNLRNDKNGR